MKYECRKLFVKRRAWLLMLGFLVLRLVTALLQPNYAADYRMELYRDSYMQHMSVLAGSLDSEKQAYIEAQNARIARLAQPDTALEDYRSGAITEEEFDAQRTAYLTSSTLREEFAAINERYAAARENPDRVFFLYSNGWVGLLGNERLDFVLIFLIMLLSVPMICDEYTTGMYPILRAAANGGARLYLAKFAAAACAALTASVLLFAAELGYYAAVLGLPGGSYPLQSLPPFSDSPYAVSIAGAAVLTLLNRMLGALLLTALMLCLSAVLRRAVTAVFLGAAGLLLPHFLLAESTLKYLLPTPLGFLLSCGFLKGRYPVTPYAADYLEITPQQYGFAVCGAVLVTLLLVITGMCVFAGLRPRRRLLLTLPALLLLTGCTGAAESQPRTPDLTGFLYDPELSQPVGNEYEAITGEDGTVYLRSRDTGARTPLIRDCFADKSVFGLGQMPYFDGDTVCYLNQYSRFHYAVIALDTRDFSETVLQEVEWSDNIGAQERLFGLGAYLPAAAPHDETVFSFCVHDGFLFISKISGIFCCDLQSGAEHCICDRQAQRMAVAFGTVYYQDQLFDLYRCDLRTGQTEKLPVDKVDHFYAVGEGIVCQALRSGEFFCVSPDGARADLLPDFDEDAFRREHT